MIILIALMAILLVALLGVVVFGIDWTSEEESEDERICAHTGEW